ncbi:MAG: hypothetical protein QM503_05870 [Bacteroidota bacterium]
MKTTIVITILTIFVVIIVSCSKSNDAKLFALSKTEYKGCFIDNPIDSTKNTHYGTRDTLYYTLKNDSLLLNVIMNYNCCGSLYDSLVIHDKDVNIYIHDTCSTGCICFCMCEFEFEYSFINFTGNNVNFYVYLKGHEEDEYSLWGDLIYP